VIHYAAYIFLFFVVFLFTLAALGDQLEQSEVQAWSQS
jgi:hypothetical protein